MFKASFFSLELFNSRNTTLLTCLLKVNKGESLRDFSVLFPLKSSREKKIALSMFEDFCSRSAYDHVRTQDIFPVNFATCRVN